MILGGWSALLLIAANTAIGDSLGHALIEGQLYFAGPVDLGAALALSVLSAPALVWLMPRLLRARLFPRDEVANALPAYRWHLGFDLLAAAAMAVGTSALGLMGAFALVFVPPWAAFRIGRGWGRTLALSAGIGFVAFTVAFQLALVLDQPFGPVLVGVLLAAAGLISLYEALRPIGRRMRSGRDRT
jgi:zinc transport system permease protein